MEFVRNLHRVAPQGFGLMDSAPMLPADRHAVSLCSAKQDPKRATG